jgi:hypothetical protein
MEWAAKAGVSCEMPTQTVPRLLAEPSQFDRSETGMSFVFNKGIPKVSTTF